MTRFTLLALAVGLSFAPAAALADRFVSKADPSGAPMCFTERGEKALLAHCQKFTMVRDPSGSPMCFNEAGGKALLRNCALSNQTAAVTATSPSLLASY